MWGEIAEVDHLFMVPAAGGGTVSHGGRVGAHRKTQRVVDVENRRLDRVRECRLSSQPSDGHNNAYAVRLSRLPPRARPNRSLAPAPIPSQRPQNMHIHFPPHKAKENVF